MRYGTRLHVIAMAVLAASMPFASAFAEDQVADTGAQFRAALTSLEAWLAASPQAEGWRAYLNLPALDAEAGKKAEADPAVLDAVLKQLDSAAPGLELAPFAKVRDALRPWADELKIARAPSLSEAALGFGDQFRQIPDSEVEADKALLESTAAKLDKYLLAGGANGAAWKKYLDWEKLQDQLKSKAPELDALKTIYQAFAADQVGLELPVFSDVRQALERYVEDLGARQPEVPAQFAEHLKKLAEALKQYAESPSEDVADAVGAELGWLAEMRQAGALVRAVRNRYSRPNLYAQVSGRFVAVGIDQQIDDVAPVRDIILGTDISGTGHTVGRIVSKLVPSEQSATIELRLAGTTATKTVGLNGPATIYSNGTTSIDGRKRIVIDANGFASYPAPAGAATKTQITGVGAGGAMAQRVASQRVYEKKAQAEAIGSQHAADRVRRRLELQVGEQLWKAQSKFQTEFRGPLIRRGALPDLLKFSTTEQALLVKALEAGQYHLGAPGDEPKITVPADVSLQLHESMVNNMATALLSGATIKEEELKAKVIEWRGSLPERFKADEDQEPLSITFARLHPITLALSDGGFKITIRGQRYVSGSRRFAGMNVTAEYKMSIDGAGARLVRQGELKIVPPRGGPLSASQIALRTVLQHKFGRLFEEEIKSDGLKLSGRWEAVGPLELKQLQAGGGWLAVAWLEPTAPAESTTKVTAERE